MKIVAAGLSNKTAPLDIRERYAVKAGQEALVAGNLREQEPVSECVVLSTCNRVEIYGVVEDSRSLVALLAGLYPGDGDLSPYLYVHEGKEAVRHLCYVACGLDSMVLGEPQIFGQVKESFARAAEYGGVGPVLRSLFPRVFSLVKNARTATGIGRTTTSVSHAAVDLARAELGELQGKRVLMIGAGEMGEIAVRVLKAEGISRLYVTNRTFERAVRLAESLGGTPIMFYEMPEYLRRVEIAICALSAPEYIIHPDDVAVADAEEAIRKLLVIDISVPRSVDPRVAEISGVRLCNTDDLERIVSANSTFREQEGDKARAIIDGKLGGLMTKLDSRELVEAIDALREAADQAHREAVEQILRLGAIPPSERAAVDSVVRSVVNKVVSISVEQMRQTLAGSRLVK